MILPSQLLGPLRQIWRLIATRFCWHPVLRQCRKGGDNADDVMNVTDPISGITFQIALYRQYRQCAMKLTGMGCFISEAGTWLSDSWLNIQTGLRPHF